MEISDLTKVLNALQSLGIALPNLCATTESDSTVLLDLTAGGSSDIGEKSQANVRCHAANKDLQVTLVQLTMKVLGFQRQCFLWQLMTMWKLLEHQ